MATPSDSSGLLDRLKAAVKPTDSPTSTRAQIVAVAVLLLIGGVWVLLDLFGLTGEVRIDGLLSVSLDRLMRALLVLWLWGILIAELWRGPLQPPLLIGQGRTSGWRWGRSTKLPSDYVREGQPVPRSAVAHWWRERLLVAIVAVGFTYRFLAGG